MLKGREGKSRGKTDRDWGDWSLVADWLVRLIDWLTGLFKWILNYRSGSNKSNFGIQNIILDR